MDGRGEVGMRGSIAIAHVSRIHRQSRKSPGDFECERIIATAGADGAVGESFAPQAVQLSADSKNMRRASVSRILEPDQGLERLESTCEAFSFPFWSSVQP